MDYRITIRYNSLLFDRENVRHGKEDYMRFDLPETTHKLEISTISMYFRAVEVVLLRQHDEEADSEIRILPLRMGDRSDKASVVNEQRLVNVQAFLDKCKADFKKGDKVIIKLHLAMEFDDPHTVFTVIIRDRLANIKLPEPTGPRIALSKSLSIIPV